MSILTEHAFEIPSGAAGNFPDPAGEAATAGSLPAQGGDAAARPQESPMPDPSPLLTIAPPEPPPPAIEETTWRREAVAVNETGRALRELALNLPDDSSLRTDLLESAADYLALGQLRGQPCLPPVLVAPPRSG
jgi:hypothetical protein